MCGLCYKALVTAVVSDKPKKTYDNIMTTLVCHKFTMLLKTGCMIHVSNQVCGNLVIAQGFSAVVSEVTDFNI